MLWVAFVSSLLIFYYEKKGASTGRRVNLNEVALLILPRMGLDDPKSGGGKEKEATTGVDAVADRYNSAAAAGSVDGTFSLYEYYYSLCFERSFPTTRSRGRKQIGAVLFS